jgi:hypothetical protein
MNTTEATLNDAILETVMEAGFLPADGIDDHDYSAAVAATLHYFAGRNWDCYRTGLAVVAFVRWGEDGIDLMTTTLSGVIEDEAHFSFGSQGVAWFAAAVAS